jgi:adenine-specific DNA-methyltransferase
MLIMPYYSMCYDVIRGATCGFRRNLLRDDGVIFVSIDDNEVHNLRMLMNEVFGDEQFIGQMTWKNVTDNNPTNITTEHEYIVCYARSKGSIAESWKSTVSDVKNKLIEIGKSLNATYSDATKLQAAYSSWFRENKAFLVPMDRYKYIDQGGVYIGSQSVHNPGREGYRYDVIHPLTKKPCKQPLMGYRFPKESMDRLLQEDRIIFGEDHNKIIELKVYAKEYQDKLSSVIQIDGRLGSYELKELFPEVTKIFDSPKSIELIGLFSQFVLEPSDIALDFFAGSGTTAQAVLEQNHEDGGNRKFILVQLPEKTDNPQYPTIAHITRERVRRVVTKLNEADAGKLDLDGKAKQDRGFRALKLSSSNFKIWDADRAATEQELLAKQLHLYADNLAESRSQQDVLYELILKGGLPLTAKVETQTVAGKIVHSIADGSLLICLESHVTQELLRGMMALEPLQILCLDAAFHGNDPLKTNAVLEAKSHGITFRTV